MSGIAEGSLKISGQIKFKVGPFCCVSGVVLNQAKSNGGSTRTPPLLADLYKAVDIMMEPEI